MNQIEMSTAGLPVLDRIIEWNRKRNNLNFSHYTGVKLLAEELFELCLYGRDEAKFLSKEFADDNAFNDLEDPMTIGVYEDRKAELVDALGDLVFIAVGEIGKLGYDPNAVMTAICDANDKKGSKKDASGKILKDNTFVEPVHA